MADVRIYRVRKDYRVEVPTEQPRFGELLDYAFGKLAMDEEEQFELMRELRTEAFHEGLSHDNATLEEIFFEKQVEWLVDALVEMHHVGNAEGWVHEEEQQVDIIEVK